MSKARVLFFAADPLSAGGRVLPLALDNEFREIQQRVRRADHRDALEFAFRPAARTSDLAEGILQVRPQVVHFSGHGTRDGLVLLSSDGKRPHVVPPAALTRLFEAYRGEVRVVLLNACFSHAQAEAIASVIGCAIGPREKIPDKAAITFGSAFYQALAFGKSVKTAHELAQAELAIEGFDERQFPEIVLGPGIDPAQLFLVEPPALPDRRRALSPERPDRWGAKSIGVAAAAIIVSASAIVVDVLEGDVVSAVSVSDIACGARWPVGQGMRGGGAPAVGPLAPSPPLGPEADLARGKTAYGAGDYAAAAGAFERAAAAGEAEAMSCLGFMYLRGKGVARQPSVAVNLLRDAASEKRNGHGMFVLAMAYLNGEGVNRSERYGREWLQKSIKETGFIEAMRSLGNLYEQERNDSSYRYALSLYERAGRAGSADAKVDAGRMYELGLGTRRDGARAFQLYQAAAFERSPRGMYALGQSYLRGVGVAKNHAQAMVWFRSAAHAGSAEAMKSIGALYEHGLGVRRSRLLALLWSWRADRAGSAVTEVNVASAGST